MKSFKEILTEAKNEIPRGLLKMVADYITMRSYGNVSGAKQSKKFIDSEIKKLKLNSKDVYFYFGNPDDPKQKLQIEKNIDNFKKEIKE